MSNDKGKKEDRKEELYSEEENISKISFNDLLSGKVKLNNPEEERATKEEMHKILADQMSEMFKTLSEVSKPIKGIADIVEVFNIQSEIYESFMIPSLSDAMSNYLETLKTIENNLKNEIESYGVEYIPYELGNDIKLLKMILKSNNTRDDLSTPLLGYIFTAFNTHTKEYQGDSRMEGNDIIVDAEIPEEKTEVKLFYDLFTELLGVKDTKEVKQREKKVSKNMELFYKQSLELINQERQSEETRYKLFNEAKIDKSRLDDIGLNLSDGEIRALHAVTKLLDKTGHKGHETDMIRDPFGKFVPSPVVYTSLSEYYDSYELPKDKKGYYQKKQREIADKNLEALSKTHTIVGRKKISEKEEKNKNGKKKTRDIVRTIQTDVTLIKRTFIDDFDPKELEKKGIDADKLMKKLSTIRRDTDLTGKNTLLILRYDPFFVERIETFFTLLPTDLYQKAKIISNNKYVMQTVGLLKLIHMHRGKQNKNGYPELKRHYKKLALTLGLNADIESRHYSRAIKKMEYSIDRLIEYGYLLPESSYNAGTDMITLVMNPDKLPRAGAFNKRQLQKTIGDDQTK